MRKVIGLLVALLVLVVLTSCIRRPAPIHREYVMVSCEDGVAVLDVTKPDKVKLAGYYDTPGWAHSVFVHEDYAYIADDQHGLVILDVSRPRDPELVGEANTRRAMSVYVEGDYAYVADGEDGLVIFDISDKENPVLKGTLDTNFAWAVVVHNGLAYVADGNKFLIVDVSNPSKPVKKWELEIPSYDVTLHTSDDKAREAYVASGDGVSVIDVSATPTLRSTVEMERVLHVHYSKPYLYVTSGEELAVLRVSNPSSPEILDSIALGDELGSIYVNKDENTVYVAAKDKGLQIVNASDTENLEKIGEFLPKEEDVFGNFLTLSGNYLYVVSNWRNLAVYDLEDPASPSIERNYSTGKYIVSLDVVGDRAYVAGQDGLMVYDVSDPMFPNLDWELPLDGWANSVQIVGKLAYITTWSGLNIVDLDSRNTISQVPIPGAGRVKVLGNYAYVASGGDGFVIVNVSDPNNPFIVNGWETESAVLSIDALSGRVYVAEGENGFTIFDVSDPNNPKELSHYGLIDAYDVKVVGSNLYVAAGSNGFAMFDVLDPTNPEKLGQFDTDGMAVSIDVEGENVYVADSYNGVVVLDVSDPSKPVVKWGNGFNAPLFSTVYGM